MSVSFSTRNHEIQEDSMRKCLGPMLGLIVLAMFASCTDNNVPTISQPASPTVNNDLLDNKTRAPLATVCGLDKTKRTSYILNEDGSRTSCGKIEDGRLCAGDVISEQMKGVCYTDLHLARAFKMAKEGKADWTFDPEKLIVEATGECAPPYGTVCGSFINAYMAGDPPTPFNGMVVCHITQVGGQNVTTMVPVACDEGKTCEMGGNAPTFAVCSDIPSCTTDAECPDTGDACTMNVCNEATELCETVAFGEGDACNDGNACTVGDTCVVGVCMGDPLTCDDSNTCTVNACNPIDGCYYNEPAIDGTPCDDADWCTLDETCTGGTCTPAVLNRCDDDDVCNGVEGCSSALKMCLVPPPDSPDVALDCDDGNVCTADSCDPTDGCVNTNLPDGQECLDDDLCTEGETCQLAAGNTWSTCTAGTPENCDDGNPCTIDECDPFATSNACMPKVNEVDGTPCDPENSMAICVDGTCTDQYCTGLSPEGCHIYQKEDGQWWVGMRNCVIPAGMAYGTYSVTDCGLNADWDCWGNECLQTAGSLVETNNCADGVDNDSDGVADCLDPDCASDAACTLMCTVATECEVGQTCFGGACCTPDCSVNQCGDDGCGGECGPCTGANEVCNASQQCECVPDCTAADSCGNPDGCSGTCVGTSGNCSTAGETCNAGGLCEVTTCVPDCTTKQCGDDGCGGECGLCAANEVCNALQQCECVPDCTAVACGGSDGCSGTCTGTNGTCPAGETCNASGSCVATGGGCTTDAECPSGQYCFSEVCYDNSDAKGDTPYGASGANGGPDADGTPDNFDDDGDGYCEVAPCVGSRNPELNLDPGSLLGGDCDDNPSDGSPFTLPTPEGDFQTDGSHANNPSAFEWCETPAPGFDNDCDGTPNDGCP